MPKIRQIAVYRSESEYHRRGDLQSPGAQMLRICIGLGEFVPSYCTGDRRSPLHFLSVVCAPNCNLNNPFIYDIIHLK